MGDSISTLLDKVSSYNFFNYLFTGAVFLLGVDRIAATNCAGRPLIAFVLVAYFMGMVLSRIGSLVVEPVFRKIGFVKYGSYAEFVKAEKVDPKIAVLLEVNNTYRTLTALFAMLLLIKMAVHLCAKYPLLTVYAEWAWPVSLALLFAASFRKQTRFVYQRVAANSEPAERRG